METLQGQVSDNAAGVDAVAQDKVLGLDRFLVPLIPANAGTQME